ncbi:hypothetical protein WOSG25_050580 [Weissella oryzae SG25]|uniref:Uncharacterized protein n=1 Tax=Weissella oryzae (strain DSM 25784 / JCM 18191 / LMG 30913 / SG25) TaxID=1329250 RepID=A0A069D0G6_WEIOS|nr:TcpD family membrane protein [Weissella oryzae]GAK30786.1 hypothetical protein WOSG25_050580 [Weissella oryzae SG25]
MDLYSSIKPAFVTLLLLAGGGRVLFLFFQKQTRTMWMTIGIVAVLGFFINGPQETINAGNGLIRLVLNWISTIGG